MLRRSQIVGNHAEEKRGDQHCGDECEHTNHIHGVLPRDGVNICNIPNLLSEQTAGISAGKHGISAETGRLPRQTFGDIFAQLLARRFAGDRAERALSKL
jgi:hypothetical protein